MAEPIDVVVENHGSVFLFRALTLNAMEWIANHVSEDAQYFGSALAVEHRYARDLAEAMNADGLRLK